jgi:TorA maturation chaperone TorD
MKEFLSREEYRGNSYKLLSECYYPPDEKLIKILNGLEKSRGGLYSEIARNIPGMSDIESLKVDYSKLFVGPYELLAPPYGSVYLEDARRVMGNSTMDAMNKYREEGLDSILKEAPDHIAIELEYMYFLSPQKACLDSHLGRWVSEFANNVEANGQTEFYKNLARCTRLFVLEDLKSLPDKLTVSFCQTEKIGGMQ